MSFGMYKEYAFMREMEDRAKCKAIDVAKYIVTYCKKKGNPIQNLKLQYMMYLCWKEFYNLTKTALFIDDMFVARKFGSTVPEVYYEFCIFAGNPIYREYEVSIEESCKIFIEECIDKYMEISCATLGTNIRKQGSPWDIVRKNDGTYIPFLSIAASEVEVVNINNIVEESIEKMREFVEYFLENTKKYSEDAVQFILANIIAEYIENKDIDIIDFTNEINTKVRNLTLTKKNKK